MRKILSFAVLALTGCVTVGPDYQRPDVKLPGQFSDSSSKEPASVPIGWWSLYRDPVLEDLMAGALADNIELRIAAARVQESEAVFREIRGTLYPEVNAGYAATRTKVSASTVPPPSAVFPLERPQHTAVVSTSYELDFWGRYSRANEAAQANLLSSRLSRDVVALTLSGVTAQAYFGVRSLDAQIEVFENAIRVRRDSLAIAEARARAGLASELDVYQAQGALADAMVQRRDAQRGRALLERQLGQLIGRLDLKVPAGKLFALPVPPTPPAGLPSSLLERRPDIRAAEEGLVASNALIGVARAALFPSLSLTGSLGTQSAEFSSLFSDGSGIWALGIGVNLPIFDAGRRRARVDQASARSEQSLAGYQRSVETAFREVADALENVSQSGDAEAELQLRLAAARNALELSNVRYESGYSPYLEVLDAQRTANDAEIAYVRNRQARLAFSVDLMKALGGGWTEEK